MIPGSPGSRRSLAGATILQLVPALHDDPAGNAAVDIALTLLQSGARAIVAGDEGALVGKLCAFGGEWLPMTHHTINPLRIFQNARRLARLIADERIDIVHAQSAAGAWSARSAIDRMPIHLVTSFPDRVPARSWAGDWFRTFACTWRPCHRTVELCRARHGRPLQTPCRTHHRHPARYRRHCFRSRRSQRGSHQFAAPRLGRIARHACRSGAGSPCSVEWATRHGRRRTSFGHWAATAILYSCLPATIEVSRAMCVRCAVKHACTASTRFAGLSVNVRICRPPLPSPTSWQSPPSNRLCRVVWLPKRKRVAGLW